MYIRGFFFTVAMIRFTSLTASDPVDLLPQMMLALYAEDPACNGKRPTLDSCRQTIRFLLQHPERGRIILLTENEILCGYAILIPYWSNEFAGTLLFVDELFVMPELRGRGIATAFLNSLKNTPPFEAVGLSIEGTKRNARAKRLYGQLGFADRANEMMICPLRPHNR